MKTLCILTTLSLFFFVAPGCRRPEATSANQPSRPTGRIYLDMEPVSIELHDVALSDALRMFHRFGGGLVDARQFTNMTVTATFDNIPSRTAAEQLLASVGYKLVAMGAEKDSQGWYDIVPIDVQETNGISDNAANKASQRVTSR